MSFNAFRINKDKHKMILDRYGIGAIFFLQC
jgi:hypothetical protein